MFCCTAFAEQHNAVNEEVNVNTSFPSGVLIDTSNEPGTSSGLSPGRTKWGQLKAAVAIAYIRGDRSEVNINHVKVENELLSIETGDETEPSDPEQLEALREVEELGDLITKADTAGGSRQIIEALISEVLKLQKKIHDLTAELEEDDDDFDEYGQKGTSCFIYDTKISLNYIICYSYHRCIEKK